MSSRPRVVEANAGIGAPVLEALNALGALALEPQPKRARRAGNLFPCDGACGDESLSTHN